MFSPCMCWVKSISNSFGSMHLAYLHLGVIEKYQVLLHSAKQVYYVVIEGGGKEESRNEEYLFSKKSLLPSHKNNRCMVHVTGAVS